MSKKALGRGLHALLSDELGENPSIKEIAIADIIPNPDQPRKNYDPQALQELADSLLVHGLLQPILVRRIGENYHIIAGERRLRAAKIAGFTKISAIVQICTDQEMAERTLIENIQRADLNPVEEGFAYARLIEEHGMTQEQVAQRVGKARATVANLLRVIQLPEMILNFLRDDRLSLGHCKILLGLKDPALQISTAEKIIKDQLSVRETEGLSNEIIKKPIKVKLPPKNSSLFHHVEDQLRNSFQTKVQVKGDLKKGKIEIQYFSEEELNRLLDLWNIKVY